MKKNYNEISRIPPLFLILLYELNKLSKIFYDVQLKKWVSYAEDGFNFINSLHNIDNKKLITILDYIPGKEPLFCKDLAPYSSEDYDATLFYEINYEYDKAFIQKFVELLHSKKIDEAIIFSQKEGFIKAKENKINISPDSVKHYFYSNHIYGDELLKSLTIKIKANSKKIGDFLNLYLGAFQKDKLLEDENSLKYCFEKQRSEFLVGLKQIAEKFSAKTRNISEGLFWNNSKGDYDFIETALSIEKEGIIEIKEINPINMNLSIRINPILLSEIFDFNKHPSKIQTKYDSSKNHLTINGKIIPFKDSFSADLLKLIFKNNKNQRKTWNNDEIFDGIKEVRSSYINNKRKIYDACRGINSNIATKTGLKKYLIFDTKTCRLNPDYI